MLQFVAILIRLGEILLVVNLVALVVRTNTKHYGVQTATLLLLSSQFWGFAFWVWCIAVAYQFWGLRTVVLGVLLGGVGIIPVTGIGLFVDHYWPELGQFTFQASLALGSYVLASRMVDRE